MSDRLGPSLGGHVLVTSRLGRWPINIAHLPLEVLLPGDAARYLQDRVAKEGQHAGDETAARKLAEELGFLPLARNDHGSPVVATRKGGRKVGTRVSMSMPWTSQDVEDIVSYFHHVLVPDGAELKINVEAIRPRKRSIRSKRLCLSKYLTGAAGLSPLAKTQVRIVPVIKGEIPTVYEMGMPVCPLEWDQAYHLDVAQLLYGRTLLSFRRLPDLWLLVQVASVIPLTVPISWPVLLLYGKA